MAKSYVSMGFEQCPVCLTEHNETVLLHKQFKQVLDKRTCTGNSLCPVCAAKSAEYIALVECTGTRDNPVHTGNYAHLRRSAVEHVINVPIPADAPLAFVEVGVIDKLKKMMENAT